MLLKAHNGLVEGNTIDGSSISGIVLSPELWWNEACYSRNVIIRNNIVRNLPDNPRSSGAIIVGAATDRYTPGYGHKHIVLENNQIQNVNVVNLLITSAEDVAVRNNRFVNAQQVASSPRGAALGEDAGALVYITEAKDVRIEGNTVSGLGPANRSLVKTTPTATQIQSDWK
jgi:nitrous oxidase accessory protein NosD